MRANAELIDTSSASSLWAERFQSELTDPFELQEAVTGRIAASLHLQLVRAEHRRSIAERTTDLDAYDLRLRAMAYLIDKVTPENTLAARRDLEKSVALDPNSAQAWAELANVLMIDVLRDWNNATKEVGRTGRRRLCRKPMRSTGRSRSRMSQRLVFAGSRGITRVPSTRSMRRCNSIPI